MVVMKPAERNVRFNWQSRLAYKLGRSERPLSQSDFTASEIVFLNRLFWHLFNDLLFAIALVVTIIIMTWSFYADYSGGTLNLFSRSGAILVAVAIVAEFGVSQIPDIADGQDIETKVSFEFLAKALRISATTAVISGTAVWAYGDLLILYLLSH